jgi:hypothetical protein
MDVLTSLRCAARIIGVVAVLSPGLVLTAQETIEPDVKATFLYNFTRFIEWPGPTTPGPAPFRICVVADPPMEQAIKRTVEGEVVQGRPLVMSHPQTAQEAAACQILFVGRTEHQRAAGLLAAVRDLPVLTVGDSSQFIEQGGTIRFVLVDNRVRFDVNLASAQRANLKMSANLLRVARKVEPNK